MKIAKGELLLLSTGSYSDYRFGPLLIAKKDLDIEKIKTEILKLDNVEYNPQNHYFWNLDGFTEYLVNESYCDEIRYNECNLEEDE